MCLRWLLGLPGPAAPGCPVPTGAASLCWWGRTELRCCSPASGRNCWAEGACGTQPSLRGTRWEQGAATRPKHVEAGRRVVSQLGSVPPCSVTSALPSRPPSSSTCCHLGWQRASGFVFCCSFYSLPLPICFFSSLVSCFSASHAPCVVFS